MKIKIHFYFSVSLSLSFLFNSFSSRATTSSLTFVCLSFCGQGYYACFGELTSPLSSMHLSQAFPDVASAAHYVAATHSSKIGMWFL